MGSKSDQLRAHLAVIAEHTRDALALLDEGELAPGLSLPKGSDACRHPRKQPGMGGYVTCLECGARWKDA